MPTEPQPRTRFSPFWSEGSLSPFGLCTLARGTRACHGVRKERQVNLLTGWGLAPNPRELLGSNVGSGARRTGQEDQGNTSRHAGKRVLRDLGRRSGHLGRLHTQGATAMGKTPSCKIDYVEPRCLMPEQGWRTSSSG